ncbi:hypothetical protein EON64_04190 [archaeon]|nr:MAG: hypothetical protein EON64_04190 [archaeon]
MLHGTFDFVLFFMGALQVAYDIESVGLTVCFFLLPFGIALAGLVYAVRTYSEVFYGVITMQLYWFIMHYMCVLFVGGEALR